MGFSRIAQQAQPSPAWSLNARARALAAEGADVLVFTVGESDFDTPDNVCAAAERAIREGRTRYTPHAGTPEVRRAVAEKLLRDNGLDYSPEEIMVSNGAKQAIFQIMVCLLDPGDEVLLPVPYWLSFADQAVFCGADVVPLDTTAVEGMRLTAEMVEEAITDRTRLLVLNSPCNPSGVVLRRDDLLDIMGVALEHDLWIISDEIYEKLVYDGWEHVSPASLSEEALRRVVTVGGVSKAYAMTGWRIGYAAGSADLIQAATNVQSTVSSAPNTIAQVATVEALTGPQDAVAQMREVLQRRRDLMFEGLTRIPGLSCVRPAGAFYVFPDCRGLLGGSYRGREVRTSRDLSEALLEEAHIAVLPGTVFGAEGHLRLSFATDEGNIQEGMARFRRFVEDADD